MPSQSSTERSALAAAKDATDASVRAEGALRPLEPVPAEAALRPLGPVPAERRSALPPVSTARTFALAWLAAIAVHLVVVALLIGVGNLETTQEEPLVRLVFVEPPPPPAAALGAPNGGGTARAAEAVTAPATEPPTVAEKPVAEAPAADRLRHADAPLREKSKPKPSARPKPPAPPRAKPRTAETKPPAAAPAPVEPAPGIAQGTVDGTAGGVVGGVAGGIAGGVVGGTGTGPVPLSQVAHAPVLVRRIEPVYPEVARRRRIEGLVLLEAILDREGNVEPGIKVLQSVPMLDREALAAVAKWRFRPARSRDGTAVRVILEIPIRFVLR